MVKNLPELLTLSLEMNCTYRFYHEELATGTVTKAKIIMQRSNLYEKLSPEQKTIFRRTVHEMIRDCSKKGNLDHETPMFPTVRLLHQRLVTIRSFPRCSKTTVHNILAFMGFKRLGNHDIDSAMLVEV